MFHQAQRVTCVFRTIVLAGAAVLVTTLIALSVSAQNSVPATAVQAAKSPKFASKLAHSAVQSGFRPARSRLVTESIMSPRKWVHNQRVQFLEAHDPE